MMHRHGAIGRCVRTSMLLSTLACAGEQARREVPIVDTVNAESFDAALALDAGAPGNDAASDAQRSTLRGSECAGDIDVLPAVHAAGRTFAVAVVEERVEVATLVPSCGGSLGHSNAQALALTRMTTSASASAAPLIIGSAGCDQTSLPSVIAGRGTLNLFYASNHGLAGTPQVFVKDATNTSEPVQYTASDDRPIEDMVVRVDNSRALELVLFRGGALSALRTSDQPRPLLSSAAGSRPRQLAVTNVGTAPGDTVAAVAWIGASAAVPGVYVGFYDDSSPLSAPVSLASSVRDLSSLAMATQAGRAAVVFSDATGAVFLHTLERDKTVGEPVRLTSGNQEVSDVSIARYGIGYVVAYRSLALAGGQSSVRLLLIDELGNQAGTRLVADARVDGRGLDVQLGSDGRFVVTWADTTVVTDSFDGGPQVESAVKVARVTCP